jgi:membrane fusion protein, multidrug efflux system
MDTKETKNAPTVPAETEAGQRRRAQRLLLFNIISCIIVVIALAWAVVTYFQLGKAVYTNDAQVESYINPINTRIQGYIADIRFSEHQHVKKGDTLVLIDDREYRIQVKQAEAVLMDAAAGRTVVDASEDVARNGVDVSEANIAEIAARLENAETNYRRYANLLKEDVVTQFQFDQQRAERDALKAKYESLLHARQGARFISVETDKRTAVSKAAILRATAALDYSRLNLSYTVIRAPYDGTVGRKVIEEGQFVLPGQTLVNIVRGDERWVTANYTESQLADIRLGQRVKILVDAFGDQVFYGSITAVSEAAGSRFSSVPVDNSTGNFVKVQQRFPVRIDFARDSARRDVELLKAGMNVEVELVK